MKTLRFAALVLAGGFSTRMNQFKPLLPLGGSTVLGHVISTFKTINIDVFLVTGYRNEDIVSAVEKEDITVVFNPEYKQGMFNSIQAGIRKLQADYSAFFLLPADIPLVKPATLIKLMEAGRKNPGKIIYPVYNGERGHPPLIPSSLIREILDWRQGGGLNAALGPHKNTALDLPVKDRFILFDIDTPEDYRKLIKDYRLE